MFRRLMLAFLAAVLALMVSAVPALAEVNKIVQPDKMYAGMTYGEWSAKWWQYAVGVTDPNADCTVNQSGPIWFLAGAPSSDGPVPLSCIVPPGKAILVPVINAEWSTNEDMGCGNTYQSLLACAAAFMDQVTQRSFSIDGAPVDLGPNPQNQSRFRVQSPLPPFTIHAIVGNSFVPAGTGTAVADGFYVLIKPLTPGSHRLLFSGTITFADGSTFMISTDYSVTVGH